MNKPETPARHSGLWWLRSAPFYRITELWFDSAEQLQQIAATPEWKKIVEDVPNFASGGATVLISKIE